MIYLSKGGAGANSDHMLIHPCDRYGVCLTPPPDLCKFEPILLFSATILGNSFPSSPDKQSPVLYLYFDYHYK